jgi:hypothetical protein
MAALLSAWHVFFIETVCFSGGDSAIARGRIRKCNARSSGLLLWCLDWLRTSPCLSCGRCWPPFPSASLAGGWPIAATGSDAGIPGRSDSSTPFFLRQHGIVVDRTVTTLVHYLHSVVRPGFRETPYQAKSFFSGDFHVHQLPGRIFSRSSTLQSTIKPAKTHVSY